MKSIQRHIIQFSITSFTLFSLTAMLLSCNDGTGTAAKGGSTGGSSASSSFDSDAVAAAKSSTGENVTYTNEQGETVKAVLFVPEGEGPFAAVVVGHGCGGLRREANDDSYDNIESQFRRWAKRLQRGEGASGALTETPKVVLLVDSFTSRGENFLECDDADDNGFDRETLLKLRGDDLNTAGAELAALSIVDENSIAYMGFSNGGSSGLYLSFGLPSNEGATLSNYQFAAVYYPGCGLRGLAGSIEEGEVLPQMPVLMLHAEKDDLEEDCTTRVQSLEGKAADHVIEYHVFEGADHGFDNADDDDDEADVKARDEALKLILGDDWLGSL